MNRKGIPILATLHIAPRGLPPVAETLPAAIEKLVREVNPAGRPLHIQCSYPSRPLIKIITLYEPEPAMWIDFKVRRKR